MRSFATLVLAAVVPAIVSATNFTVNVGANGQLAFEPPSMNASTGDMISFVFQSKNHSVYSSSFGSPCTSNNQFESGFFPVNGSNAVLPSFTINITQSEPVWFYCAQTSPVNHCKAGMVGVINPTADKTFAAFQANAMGNSTSNSSSSAGQSAAGSATGTAAPASSTSAKSSAVRIGGSAAMLTLVGVVVGLTV